MMKHLIAIVHWFYLSPTFPNLAPKSGARPDRCRSKCAVIDGQWPGRPDLDVFAFVPKLPGAVNRLTSSGGN